MIDIVQVAKNFFSNPEPAAKKQWVKEFARVTIHTQRKDPGELIKKRRPTEAQEIHEYRLQIFEHITHGKFNRAIESIQAVMKDSNAAVEAPENLRNYISELRFDNLSFWQWLNSKVVRRIINDPNGQLIWWPKGEGVQLSNKAVDVQPILLLSKNIKHYGEYIAWLSDEVNVLQGANNQKTNGEVYYLVDDTWYYKYVQTGFEGKKTFELRPYYKHNLGKIPAITLGGDEISDTDTKTNKETVYLTSFLAGAIPAANEAIKNYSDHQGSVVTAAHPIREMDPIDCPDKNCVDGKTREQGLGVEHWKTCVVCKGEGRIVPSSPYGVIIRPKSHKTIGGPRDLASEKRDVYKLHAPDTTSLEYLEKHWRNWLLDVEKELNILRVEDAQSGVAKEIDREGKVSMIDKFGLNFFQHIVKQSYDIIGGLRFINTKFDVKVVLPHTFRPETEHELTEYVTNLKEKKAPHFLIRLATMTLIKKRYATDKVVLKISEYLLFKDPLFIYSEDEKNNLIGNGTIDLIDAKISLKAPGIISGIIRKQGIEKFLDMEFEAIDKIFDAEVAQIKATNEPLEYFEKNNT